MKFIVNQSDFVDIAPLPEGVYDAVIIRCDALLSQAGNSMLKWVVRLQDSPKELPFYTLTEKGKNYAYLRTLKALGCVEGEYDTDDFVGRAVRVRLAIEPGEFDRNSVKAIMAA